ncbi:hypothetical protein N9F67_01010, partial [bacterium]|nr:hypothetical protein [bacterium]
MATFNKDTKSNRLLQSKRYTVADFDSAEAYTSVLDLNASEVWTQQNLLPTSSLPYSGSAQNGSYITSGSGAEEVNIAEFYWRIELSPTTVEVSSKLQTWFTVEANNGTSVDPQIIQPDQITNWISNKYASSSLVANSSDSQVSGQTPGYNVVVLKGATALDATPEDQGNYQFDYKSGIVQFVSTDVAPSSSDKLWLTGYVYVGQTLANFVAAGGGS